MTLFEVPVGGDVEPKTFFATCLDVVKVHVLLKSALPHLMLATSLEAAGGCKSSILRMET